jgi:hypothetical protein
MYGWGVPSVFDGESEPEILESGPRGRRASRPGWVPRGRTGSKPGWVPGWWTGTVLGRVPRWVTLTVAAVLVVGCVAALAVDRGVLWKSGPGNGTGFTGTVVSPAQVPAQVPALCGELIGLNGHLVFRIGNSGAPADPARYSAAAVSGQLVIAPAPDQQVNERVAHHCRAWLATTVPAQVGNPRVGG